MIRSRRLVLLLASLTVLAFALALAVAACTGGDDSGGRTASDDDNDDDDQGDDAGDDTGMDCSDIRANPYCMEDVTFELPANDEGVIRVRSLFLRFDNYDLAANDFDLDVAAGTAANPSQPDTDYVTSSAASFANNPGWSASLPELTMPVDIVLPEKGPKAETDVTVTDVELTGIFDVDGGGFTFGSVAFNVPGAFLTDILGAELCAQLADLVGFDPCSTGLPVERQNLDGIRRDDAEW